MRKSLLLTLSLLTVFLVTGCLLLQPPEAELRTITIDGDLSDWGNFLVTDSSTDSRWGPINEVFKGGIILDNTNLYIAGEFTKEGYNNLMVMIDIDGVRGAADTDKHPWNRKYKFDRGDVDLVVETWGEGGKAWRFTTDASEITFEIKGVNRDDGRKVVEIAIPLSVLNVVDAKKTSMRAVFVITGGLDANGNQTAGDFLPEQPHLTEVSGTMGHYTSPVTIKFTIDNPKKN